ncbi:GntR family transcriptional regulator [Pseudogracilibacillus sp. SE30717A]|uniref:GntR family transcriptional regulator n=1 Tax=Pseudogracilibacillus sp. SE30717A TaxID=3098293 RepID=UPI00300E65FC
MKNENKRLSTIDIIYETIKQNIIELKFEPNQHLVESTLATKLGVSRTPLRHALYRLELEGLLIKRSNGRIIVSPMSIQEAKELFLVREVIEGLIAREATLNIASSEDFSSIINRLEDIVFLMRKSAETNRQEDVVSYGSNFHNKLKKYSNNITAVNMLEQINNRVARYRRLGAYKDPKYASIIPVEEHEEVLKHIKSKDEASAETAMRNHIVRSLKSTIAAISYLSF